MWPILLPPRALHPPGMSVLIIISVIIINIIVIVIIITITTQFNSKKHHLQKKSTEWKEFNMTTRRLKHLNKAETLKELKSLNQYPMDIIHPHQHQRRRLKRCEKTTRCEKTKEVGQTELKEGGRAVGVEEKS